MKTARKIIAVLLACVLFGSTMAWATDANSKEEEANKLIEEAIEKASDPDFGKEKFTPVEIVMDEAKYSLIYNPANYEDGNFEAGSVLVGLKKEVTITEGYEKLFPELNIISVSRVGKEAYESGRLLNQIIKIRLEEQTTGSVVEAITYLKDNQYVVYAEPDYYLEPATGTGNDPVSAPQKDLRGDVDGDGYVTNYDLIIIARSVVGLLTIRDIDFARADTNGDGEINNADVIAVARIVVGLN